MSDLVTRRMRNCSFYPIPKKPQGIREGFGPQSASVFLSLDNACWGSSAETFIDLFVRMSNSMSVHGELRNDLSIVLANATVWEVRMKQSSPRGF